MQTNEDLDLKFIIKHLPKDYKKYFTCILMAYTELKRANQLELYKYDTFVDNLPRIWNEKNYNQRLATLKRNFENLKLILPKDTKLINIPRKPIEIKKELEKNLFSETTQYNIKTIIEALFGEGLETRNTLDNKTIRHTKKTLEEKEKLNYIQALTSSSCRKYTKKNYLLRKMIFIKMNSKKNYLQEKHIEILKLLSKHYLKEL